MTDSVGTSDLHHFEKRQTTLEHEVNVLSKDMAEVKASVPLILDQLGIISKKVNTPEASTNWFGLVGAFVSVILVMGGGVSLMIDPIEKNLDRMNDVLRVQNDRGFADSKKLGGIHIRQETLVRELSHLDERSHWSENRIIDLEKRSAAAQVSHRAIGDYIAEKARRLERHTDHHLRKDAP